jgi:hypothetical protein
LTHLKELEKISASYEESRSVINGHLASVAYVVDYISQFSDVWKVWTENVPLQVQVDEKPPKMTLYSDIVTVFKPRIDVAVVRGSGSSTVRNASLVLSNTCDYQFDKTKSFVAVIDGTRNQKGCSSCQRMLNAINSGAKAIIFVNQPGNRQGYPHPMPPSPGRCGRYPENLETMGKVAVVALGDIAAFQLLASISAYPETTVDLEIFSNYTSFLSKNVLADTIIGEDNVILFGSHLDGVPAGPGINDDGSGSMGTLELVRAWAESPLVKKNKQKIRVAFWTAEEIGLIGSTHYVDSLKKNSPEELKKIRLSIDTDMIASPNYIRGVYDGTKLPEGKLKAGSIAIQHLFTGYFEKLGLSTDNGYFDGRSDYAAFMDNGIPCGGLFTGADAIKTPQQAKMFGGLSGVPLDPCYHQDCDRVEQLVGPGLEILQQNMEAMGFALQYLATTDIDEFLNGNK